MILTENETLIASVKRAGGYGWELKRDGTLYALTSRPHRGRAVGQRIWLGSVRRSGSGWAGFTTRDVNYPTYSNCLRQMDAGRLVYEAWLKS